QITLKKRPTVLRLTPSPRATFSPKCLAEVLISQGSRRLSPRSAATAARGPISQKPPHGGRPSVWNRRDRPGDQVLAWGRFLKVPAPIWEPAPADGGHDRGSWHPAALR